MKRMVLVLVVSAVLPIAGLAQAQTKAAPAAAPAAAAKPAAPAAAPAAAEKTVKTEKSEKTEKTVKTEKSEKVEKAEKPDCSAKQSALDDAKKAAKDVAKADLASCKDMKGKEKVACEKPLKAAAADAVKAAKEKVAAEKKALDCCKTPKKKGCE